MRLFLALILLFMIIYGLMQIGAAISEQHVIDHCDKELSVKIRDIEYVCLRVPSDGLPKNNEELKRYWENNASSTPL